MDSPKKSQRTMIRIDPDVLPRLEGWRWAQRRLSRTYAINYLLDRALTAEGWPPADSTQPDTRPVVPESEGS